MLPRVGAFEVSTVYDNVDILLFSKIKSRMWPHISALTKRLKEFAEDAKDSNGAALKVMYQT